MSDQEMENSWVFKLYHWQEKMEKQNYENLDLDEIEQFSGEDLLKILLKYYTDNLRRATDKKSLIENEIAELRKMDNLTKAGYDAKKKGINMQFLDLFDDEDIEVWGNSDLIDNDHYFAFSSYEGIMPTGEYKKEGLDNCHVLYLVAKGIAYAKYEKFLNDELLPFLTIKPENSTPLSTNKLRWKGTPGEFGAIFNLLLDNGYIELIKDKANMARILNSVFDIKNDLGVDVDTKYLYKCFGEKQRNYNPNQLKIPFSDKYHSAK